MPYNSSSISTAGLEAATGVHDMVYYRQYISGSRHDPVAIVRRR
jgi:hypothetical protein